MLSSLCGPYGLVLPSPMQLFLTLYPLPFTPPLSSPFLHPFPSPLPSPSSPLPPPPSSSFPPSSPLLLLSPPSSLFALPLPSPLHPSQAARALANLAAHGDSNRNSLAVGKQPGAIPGLLALLTSSHEPAKWEATGALWNLSFEEANRAAIASYGGVQALVRGWF